MPMRPPLTPIAPVRDIPGAVRAALEAPIGYPPLRRALTPDDHVTIVVDERLPHLNELLVPLLEHIAEIQVAFSAITLLFPRPARKDDSLAELPEPFQDVQRRIHAPADRKELRYLA